MAWKQINQTGDSSTKINYNLIGRKYYVFTDNSGLLAADFNVYGVQNKKEMIVSRDMDSSANINKRPG